jgi:hypothetical protein
MKSPSRAPLVLLSIAICAVVLIVADVTFSSPAPASPCPDGVCLRMPPVMRESDRQIDERLSASARVYDDGLVNAPEASLHAQPLGGQYFGPQYGWQPYSQPPAYWNGSGWSYAAPAYGDCCNGAGFWSRGPVRRVVSAPFRWWRSRRCG